MVHCSHGKDWTKDMSLLLPEIGFTVTKHSPYHGTLQSRKDWTKDMSLLLPEIGFTVTKHSPYHGTLQSR